MQDWLDRGPGLLLTRERSGLEFGVPRGVPVPDFIPL